MDELDAGESAPGPAAPDGAPAIAIPTGGTPVGNTSDRLSLDEKLGTISYTIPLPLTPSNRGQPDLALQCGGGGRGAFGLGTTLSVPAFAIATTTIPRYDGTDRFVFAGQFLVPRYDLDDGEWVQTKRTEVIGTTAYTVLGFRPLVETTFSRIEFWVAVDGTSFWRTEDGKGTTARYGLTALSRIADPQTPQLISQWLLDDTIDNHGNIVRYTYKPEDGVGVPATIYNHGRDDRTNRYLERIQYGNYDDGAEQFAFEVVFDYGEYDPPDPTPVRAWSARPDPFSTYRAGYEVRTYRLCRRIMMVHHLPAELGAAAVTVGALELEYDEGPAGCLLTSARRVGYRRTESGDSERAAMPAATLGYTPVPAVGTFEPLVSELQPVPGLIGPSDYTFVDLHGDGIAGVLGATGGALIYWPAIGAGKYGPANPLPAFPIDGGPAGRRVGLRDVRADGHLDLVIADPMRGGIYRNNNDGTWEPYQEMASYPPELADPSGELTDLDGSGRPDLLVAAGRTLRYYLSTGASGYGPPVTLLRPVGVPLSADTGDLAVATTAGIFGDGLQHRVLITNGRVEAWPNLGYGRFGSKVTLANAPMFDSELTARRVLVGDLVGSGIAALLFVHADHVSVYLGQSGNSFAPPIHVPAPFGIDDMDALVFTDVTGSGLPALVVSKAAPEVTHYWLRLGDGRPNVLSFTANGLGLTTEIEYRSSTDYFLADSAAGQSWVSKLAFPVMLVARTTTVDAISGTTMTRAFQYRDGYYDAFQRRLTGFGYVQTQDSTTFNPEVWHFPTHQTRALAVTQDTPEQPALHRTWALTGAYKAELDIAAQLATLRWTGDRDAIRVPPYTLSQEILEAGGETISEAHRALASRAVRQETFGVDDNGELSPAPFTVVDTGWSVRLVQPRMNGNPAVFFVGAREAATSSYEQLADDPRIEQEAQLMYDAYGSVVQSARIAYARRPAHGRTVLPGQAAMIGTVTLYDVIDEITQDTYLLGAPAQQRDFELGGIAPAARYFTFGELAAAVDCALSDKIAFGEPFKPGTPQARLYAANQTYYWNLAQSAALPLGKIAAPALVHHTQRAAFPDGYVAAVYGARVDHTMFEKAGYTQDGGPLTGLWWVPGAIDVHAGANQFYLLVATIDPFGATTKYAYDAYVLALASTVDALGQEITAAYDYQVMKAATVVSANNNTTEVLFDPLGEVIATTLYGEKAGQSVGNAPMSTYVRQPPATTTEVLADPEKYLQGVSAFFSYDLVAWATGVPVNALMLLRRDWVNWPAGSVPPPPELAGASLQYFDGALRSLTRLSEVEAAAARPDELAATAAVVWDVEGQTRYNQRGEDVRTYFPYFAADYAYQVNPVAPVVMHTYDALGREVRTRMPDGTWSETRYASWAKVHYDQDDTDPTSPFFDTPTTYMLQVQGDTLQETRVTIVDGQKEALNTYFVLDVAANRLLIIDPRFYDPAHPAAASSYAFVNRYDMLGQRLSTDSADAGLTLTLYNVIAQPVATWDGRGNAVAVAYDALHRPTNVLVTESGMTREAERVIYGTDPERNSVNEVVVHNDQAGVLTYPLYDLLGNARRVERKVLETCGPVDWSDPSKVGLLPETWAIDAEHDAANRLVREVNADGSVVEVRAYRNGWTERVLLDGATVVWDYKYDAAARTREHASANGMTSTYTYEPLTLRLASAVVAGIKTIQDLAFTYDPVGNVMSISDGVIGKDRMFTYNAVYQLITATGVQSDGVSYVERYAYDKAGNTITQTHEDVNGTSTVTIAIAKKSNRGVPASILSGDNVDDFFDESGNQRSLVPLIKAQPLAWDYRNRLVTAVGDAVTQETRYLYDSNGTRVRALRTDGVTTLDDEIYIGRCVFQRGVEAAGMLRVTANDTCVLIVRTADLVRQERYQVHDQVASVTFEIAADQSVLTGETYFPYGATATATGGLHDKIYHFNDKECDTDTELYYYGQRYYAPWQMRWISADPAGTVDGLNLFAFVGGNPATRYDAHGTCGDDKVPTPKPPPLGTTPIQVAYWKFVQTYATPTQNHKTLPYMFKDWAFYTTLAQASFEASEHVFEHGSTGALLSVARAATTAKFAGLFGLVYPSKEIYKSLSKGETPASWAVAYVTGNLLFLRESQLLYRSLYTHGLDRQIGVTGMFASLFKFYGALKKDDPKSATAYGFFALGNLRGAGLFMRLPPSPYLLIAGVVSQAIPSQYYNFVYREAVQPVYFSFMNKLSSWWKSATTLPPGGHWTESHNVLMDSLRTTTSFKSKR
jgi:RHS repeat-associated protein